MRKTGVFSGSFNPIHIGHLALANWLCEFTELDEVWFLITPQNPLKKVEELIEDQFRLEMVQAAINHYPKFTASDFEFSLPRPSYTVNTLQALKSVYPDNEFHFVMGADNWVNIERWKDYEKLLSDYPILIYPRLGYEVHISENYSNIRLVNAPVIEISSTFIRDAFRTGKDVRFFLPENIHSYISLFNK